MDLLPFASVVVLAYLVGSLSFAVIVSRCLGLSDPRTYGSGNPGATNVLRSGHKGAAVLTLVFDAIKGMVPVWVAQHGAAAWGLPEAVVACAGLASFVGHLWPVFFRFKGGKGVATAAGVLFALNPWLGLSTLLTWLAVAFLFRYSSLAGIVAAVLAPLYQILLQGYGPTTWCVLVMGALLVWRHQSNIRKLLQGTESKLGSRSSVPVSPPPSVNPGKNQS